MMTLTKTVSKILQRRVTEQEAMEFALKQYGVLVADIRYRECRKTLEKSQQHIELDAKYSKYVGKKLPVRGQVYSYFNEGVRKDSYREEVQIKKIIPFEKIDSCILEMWQKEVEEKYWIFEEETDFFLKGFARDKKKELFFARSRSGWIAIADNEGILEENEILV